MMFEQDKAFSGDPVYRRPCANDATTDADVTRLSQPSDTPVHADSGTIRVAKPTARYDRQKVIRPTRLCDFPSKQHPIAAARKDKIGAFEDLPESAAGKLRVEVSHTVEPDQARNEPVASHLASASHTSRIEV